MFAHVEPLVGGVNHKRIVEQALFFKVVEHTAHIVVERLHHLAVIAHISLVLPLGKLLARKFLGIEVGSNGVVEGIKCLAVGSVHASDVFLVGLLKARRLVGTIHLQVIYQVHVLGDAHLLRRGGKAALVVVIEVLGQGKCTVLILVQVFYLGQPVAVNGLVVDEQAERFRLVALVLHPVDAHVRYYVCQVPMLLYGVIVHGYEIGIVIVALAGNYFPIIETRGQALQVPLADDCSLVPGLLQQLGHGLLRTVEHARGIIGETVGVAVLAGEHAGTARAAERVGNETVGKAHSVASNAVEVGGLDETAAIATHHLRRVVVGHDVNYVKRLCLLLGLLARCQSGQSTGTQHCVKGC